MVMDFSAGALPIGVKFCTAVWQHLGQVFSHFGGYRPGWPNFGRQWWDMLLAEALAQFFCYSKNLSWVWGPFTDEKHHPGQEGLQ